MLYGRAHKLQEELHQLALKRQQPNHRMHLLLADRNNQFLIHLIYYNYFLTPSSQPKGYSGGLLTEFGIYNQTRLYRHPKRPAHGCRYNRSVIISDHILEGIFQQVGPATVCCYILIVGITDLAYIRFILGVNLHWDWPWVSLY